jgi:hypothetical protein
MTPGSRAIRFAIYGGLGLAAELSFTGAMDAVRTRAGAPGVTRARDVLSMGWRNC